MFSNVIENSILYILEKNNGLSLKIGKVIKKKEPQSKINNIPQYGITPSDMYVDIIVDVSGDNVTLERLPMNQSIATNGNITIIESKEDLNRIVDSLVTASKNYIDGVSLNEKIIEDGENILKEINPHLAKEKERDDMIERLNSRMDGIESSINAVLHAINNNKKTKNYESDKD